MSNGNYPRPGSRRPAGLWGVWQQSDVGGFRRKPSRTLPEPKRNKLSLYLRGQMWHLRGVLNGVPYRKSTGTTDFERAKEIATALLHSAHCIAIFGADPITPTLAEAISRYKDAVKPTSDEGKRLDRTLEIAGPKLRCNEVTNAWMHDVYYPTRFPEGVSDATKLREGYTPICAVLQHAFKNEMILNVPPLTKPKGGKRRTDFLDVEQVEAILERASPATAAFMSFMVCTGPRRGSAWGLLWQDVDLKYGWVTFRNVKSEHNAVVDLRVKLYPRARESLLSLRGSALGSAGPVFTGLQQGPFATAARFGSTVTAAMSAAARAAGIDMKIGPQLLRRTFATWHTSVFSSVQLLADVGGWTSINMANSYAQLTKPEMAADVQRFWGLGTDPNQWKVPSARIKR